MISIVGQSENDDIGIGSSSEGLMPTIRVCGSWILMEIWSLRWWTRVVLTTILAVLGRERERERRVEKEGEFCFVMVLVLVGRSKTICYVIFFFFFVEFKKKEIKKCFNKKIVLSSFD
jgi:hypothetical protein